mgnify:FL=1
MAQGVSRARRTCAENPLKLRSECYLSWQPSQALLRHDVHMTASCGRHGQVFRCAARLDARITGVRPVLVGEWPSEWISQQAKSIRCRESYLRAPPRAPSWGAPTDEDLRGFRTAHGMFPQAALDEFQWLRVVHRAMRS